MIYYKMKALELSQQFSNYKSMPVWGFFKMLKGSLLHSRMSDLAKF